MFASAEGDPTNKDGFQVASTIDALNLIRGVMSLAGWRTVSGNLPAGSSSGTVIMASPGTHGGRRAYVRLLASLTELFLSNIRSIGADGVTYGEMPLDLRTALTQSFSTLYDPRLWVYADSDRVVAVMTNNTDATVPKTHSIVYSGLLGEVQPPERAELLRGYNGLASPPNKLLLAMTVGASTMTLAAPGGRTGDWFLVDNEIVAVGYKNASLKLHYDGTDTVLNITRAMNGTAAAAHLATARIFPVLQLTRTDFMTGPEGSFNAALGAGGTMDSTPASFTYTTLGTDDPYVFRPGNVIRIGNEEMRINYGGGATVLAANIGGLASNTTLTVRDAIFPSASPFLPFYIMVEPNTGDAELMRVIGIDSATPDGTVLTVARGPGQVSDARYNTVKAHVIGDEVHGLFQVSRGINGTVVTSHASDPPIPAYGVGSPVRTYLANQIGVEAVDIKQAFEPATPNEIPCAALRYPIFGNYPSGSQVGSSIQAVASINVSPTLAAQSRFVTGFVVGGSDGTLVTKTYQILSSQGTTLTIDLGGPSLTGMPVVPGSVSVTGNGNSMKPDNSYGGFDSEVGSTFLVTGSSINYATGRLIVKLETARTFDLTVTYREVNSVAGVVLEGPLQDVVAHSRQSNVAGVLRGWDGAVIGGRLTALSVPHFPGNTNVDLSKDAYDLAGYLKSMLILPTGDYAAGVTGAILNYDTVTADGEAPYRVFRLSPDFSVGVRTA